jgi:protein-tyrosine phosphatase
MLKTKVLFVCMGNICRSPSAEGIFRTMVKSANLDHLIETSSAGTHAYHVGETPDPRALLVAKKRSVDMTNIVSRQVTADDFMDYDYILAMDWDTQTLLQQQAPKIHKHKIQLAMRYAGDSEEAIVPDPYYGGPEGFTKAFDLLEDACGGLLDMLKKRVTLYA